MTIVASDRTITSTAASIRRRVRKVRGRKAAKASAFQAQSHLAAAATGKSAVNVVKPHQANNSRINAWRRVKRLPSLLSASSQAAKANSTTSSDSGTTERKPQETFCGETMSTDR